jgi:uncharacterized protein
MLHLVGLLAFGFACVAGLAFVFQTPMIFPAGKNVWRTPDAYGWPYEDVTLEVNGETTHGWYIPARQARGTLLFFHGNAGTIADRLESIAIFRHLGLNVFIIDYGGYGQSSGRPSEKRCYADARAAWQYLIEERGETPDRLILFGRSLGAGVAVQLATEVAPRALIIESPFLSTVRMGKRMFPFLPLRLLVRHRFDSEAKIGDVSAPVLVIHSPNDEIVPYSHGQRLYELANGPKRFLEITGGHNDGFLVSEEVYTRGLETFLGELLPTLEEFGQDDD